ncbi:MAG: LysR family transcriptional regulator, partial [Alphaproteobacteria bacterium]|nr:LysR family transcriptional regulator [Alphaproteobacteria bacterium]
MAAPLRCPYDERMRGKDFGELSAFMAVAEHRNFTRAAKQLGISTSTLSQTIRNMEERLGVRLLNRTTRSVVPTVAGDTLLARMRPVVDEYEAAIESLNTFRDKPAGLLRLTVAPPVAQFVLPLVLAKFLQRYPDIRLEISGDSANVDIVAQQFDAGIRVSDRVDRDMIAVPVTGRWRLAVVGAPSYFSRRGEPKTPDELLGHNCIRVRLSSGAMLPWRFQRDDKPLDLAVSGSLVVNLDTLVEAAVFNGIGLAQGPRAQFEQEISDGRLVSVLERWQPV